MQTAGVKLRWFNDACYELKLPNGHGILIDPYIDASRFRTLSSEDVEAADYILISHTHFDHVLDIAKVSRRFDSQIFAGRLSGIELARQYDIPGWQMHLCSPGDRLETEDFVLECFRGRHTRLGDFDRPSRWPDNIAEQQLVPETMELNMLGSYEYMNYLLTLPDHTKILVWGGGATPDAIAQTRSLQPNISIVQLPRESTDQIAALYASIGGQVIFPHHHDSYIAKGEKGLQVIHETVQKTAELAPHTHVICPENGRWYSICTCIDLSSSKAIGV